MSLMIEIIIQPDGKNNAPDNVAELEAALKANEWVLALKGDGDERTDE